MGVSPRKYKYEVFSTVAHQHQLKLCNFEMNTCTLFEVCLGVQSNLIVLLLLLPAAALAQDPLHADLKC